MHRHQRLLVALALTIAVASCAPDTSVETVAPAPIQLASTTERTFTDDEIRYLAVQSWLDAERRAFLTAVAATRAAVPPLLRSIRWCEAGSYVGLPHPETNYTAMTHGFDGASGGYQMVGSTWITWATEVGVDVARWPRAFLAPDWVQDQVATHGYATRGTSPWGPSAGCWR